MLSIIANEIGGSVKLIYKKDELSFVIWVVNNNKKILEIIKIFEKYPPLTSRLQCQLVFLKSCLSFRKDFNPVSWYLINRNLKYKNVILKNFIVPDYFDCWISGFIEAKGWFSVRDDNYFFSIGQKNDYYLILAIRNYFSGINKVRHINANFYLWDVYNKDVLRKIIFHCIDLSHPLLGAKFDSLKKIISYLYN
jgi:hypothetical protein